MNSQLFSLVKILILASCFCHFAHAVVAADTLDAAKRSTVMVLTEIGSGSGFAFGSAGSTIFVTNAHVIADANQVGLVAFAGTAQEKFYPAKIAAIDSGRDLAFLKVSIPGIPPLAPAAGAPSETQPMLLAGFPFGWNLSVNKKLPTVTLTTGTVSSLRRDSAGIIQYIQVDCDVNHGNSGGPVMDFSGGVLGVIEAKMEDTKVGLAIPISVLVQDIAGVAQTPQLIAKMQGHGSVTYDISLPLIDPLQNISEATLWLDLEPGDADLGTAHPGSAGKFSPTMTAIPLGRKGDAFTGTLTIPNPLDTDKRCIVQGSWGRLEHAQWTDTQLVMVPAASATESANSPEKSHARQGAADNSDWIAEAMKIRNEHQLHPSSIDRNITLSSSFLADARLTTLDVLPSDCVDGGIAWSPDGRYVCTLETGGHLTCISMPSGHVTREVDLDVSCSAMRVTSQGLAIQSFSPKGTQWIIVAPSTLKTLRKIATPDGQCLASSQNSVMYIIASFDLFPVDTESGQCGKPIGQRELQKQVTDSMGDRRSAPPALEWSQGVFSPEGNAIYMKAGGRILSFRSNTSLSFAGISPVVGGQFGGPGRPLVAGSDLVIYPGGNLPNSEARSIDPYLQLELSGHSLNGASIAIYRGLFGDKMVGNPAAPEWYALSNRGNLAQLSVFSANGTIKAWYDLDLERSNSSTLIPAPHGSMVLVRADKLYCLEIAGTTGEFLGSIGSDHAAAHAKPEESPIAQHQNSDADRDRRLEARALFEAYSKHEIIYSTYLRKDFVDNQSRLASNLKERTERSDQKSAMAQSELDACISIAAQLDEYYPDARARAAIREKYKTVKMPLGFDPPAP